MRWSPFLSKNMQRIENLAWDTKQRLFRQFFQQLRTSREWHRFGKENQPAGDTGKVARVDMSSLRRNHKMYRKSYRRDPFPEQDSSPENVSQRSPSHANFVDFGRANPHSIFRYSLQIRGFPRNVSVEIPNWTSAKKKAHIHSKRRYSNLPPKRRERKGIFSSPYYSTLKFGFNQESKGKPFFFASFSFVSPCVPSASLSLLPFNRDFTITSFLKLCPLNIKFKITFFIKTFLELRLFATISVMNLIRKGTMEEGLLLPLLVPPPSPPPHAGKGWRQMEVEKETGKKDRLVSFFFLLTLLPASEKR